MVDHSHKVDPFNIANLDMDARIREKWQKIAQRVHPIFNFPEPLAPIDGIGLMMGICTTSAHAGLRKMQPGLYALGTQQMAQTETAFAAFFDAEFQRRYGGDTTPIYVGDQPEEIEGNPVYAVLGFECGTASFMADLSQSYLAMQNDLPVEDRLNNSPIEVLPPRVPRHVDRMVKLAKMLNEPAVGMVDRIGAMSAQIADTMENFFSRLDPTNQKTAMEMMSPTKRVLLEMLKTTINSRRRHEVLGFIMGICKTASDVAFETMRVVDEQQASGGIITG